MLWTEKYRPKDFNDVIGNGKQKKEIQMWLDEWKKGNPQPCLLLIGPAGTGKTTMAHIIAKEFSEYVELNASDKRSYDILMSTIGESASTQSLFGDNHKLLIMDEVDGIHGNDDRGGTRALNKIIKESKQPIVMMANDFYSKRLATIKNNCKVIKMTKIHTNSLNALLKRILKKEDIGADPNIVKQLAKRSNGDMRSALNTLQVITEKGGELTEKDLETISQKDNTATIFDSVQRVLKSKDPAKVKKALWDINEDPTFVMEYIAENIPREYENKKEIKKAYKMISEADLYFGRARSSRNYGYWRYASDFMGPGVALSKKETYKKFTRLTGPMAFTLMGRSRGKRALRDKIAEKMEIKMHVSLEVAYTIFPYFEIMFQNDELAWEIADFLELEDDEIKRFRKKKIPKKVITKMEKIKAKMKAEEKEQWQNDIKEGIFREIPEQNKVNSNNEEIAKSESNENSIIKDEEIAIESETKSKNKEKDKVKEDKNTKKEKDKEEPHREKGQTSLFSF